MTITAAMLAGCSSKDVEADADASTEPTSQAVSVSDTTKVVESTTVAESTTNKTTSTTKKKDGNTTTKKVVQTTTKSEAKTTAKPTTKSTTVVATTQATTKATTKATVKNVSAKDVQAQVNSYIRSKGITVDSSLDPSNSGWSGAISAMQKQLNDGTSLKSCKSYVDMEISSLGSNVSLYCYYSASEEFFYICYM